jgi:hypothetical protein
MSDTFTRESLIGSFVRQVDTGHWRDKQIYVRNLTEDERCELLDKGQVDAAGKPNPNHMKTWRRKVVIATACNASGEPLLEPTDLAKLRTADAGLIQAYYNLGVKHCGLTVDEHAEKNSDSVSGDDSPTA